MLMQKLPTKCPVSDTWEESSHLFCSGVMTLFVLSVCGLEGFVVVIRAF